MMVFSDCAFLAYDNALHGAVSLAWAMRQYLTWGIPVRICIAKGTCHAPRFSIEAADTLPGLESMVFRALREFRGEYRRSGPHTRGCQFELDACFSIRPYISPPLAPFCHVPA